MGNVSVRDFRRLEKKVDLLIEAHSSDSWLNKKEKKLVARVKKDIKTRKDAFIPLREL